MSTVALRLRRLARLPSIGSYVLVAPTQGKYVANECHARDGKGGLNRTNFAPRTGFNCSQHRSTAHLPDGLRATLASGQPGGAVSVHTTPLAGLIFLEHIVPNWALGWHANGQWLALGASPGARGFLLICRPSGDNSQKAHAADQQVL